MITLDELAKLASAATPGPWSMDMGGYVGTAYGADTPQGKMRIEFDLGGGPGSSREEKEFICAANPDTILKLIASLKEAMEALELYKSISAQRESEITRYSAAAEALASIKKRLG